MSNKSSPSGVETTAPITEKQVKTTLSLIQAFYNEYKLSLGSEVIYRDREHFWTKLAAVAAICAAVFAFVLVTISVAQAWIFRDTEQRQLRAYFGVTSVVVDCCKHIDRFTSDVIEYTNLVRIYVKNSGQTPASMFE